MDFESGRQQRHRAGVSARTRIDAVWIGFSTAIVVFAALVVFMLQNLQSMQVSFLGLHGALPTGVGLLIAMVAGAALGVVFGTARDVQSRHQMRGGRR